MNPVVHQEIESVGSLLTVVVPIGKLTGGLRYPQVWIPEALDAQIEVILVLDTDDSETINSAQELSQRYKSLILLESDCRNPGGTRTLGLKRARRDWIAFWDSDDEPSVPNSLQLLRDVIKANKTIGVGSYVTRCESTPRANDFTSYATSTQPVLSFALNPGIWRLIIKRDKIADLAFPESRMGEDQVFISRIPVTSDEIFFSNLVTYSYLQRNLGQLTQSRSSIKSLGTSLAQLNPSTITCETNVTFSEVACIRMAITGIKHCSLLDKCKTVFKFIFALHRLKVSLVKVLRILRTIRYFSKVSKNQTMVILTGGLGNQLFQLAFSLGMASSSKIFLECNLGKPRINKVGQPELLSYQLPVRTNPSSTKNVNQVYGRVISHIMRTRFNPSQMEATRVYQFAINCLGSGFSSIQSGKVSKVWAPGNLGFEKEVPLQRNKVIMGYFQTYRYAQQANIREQLKDLKMHEEPSELLAYRELAQVEKPLVVHVRLTDYRNEQDFGMPGIDYYRTAIQTMNRTNLFNSIWLFSDEPTQAMEIAQECAGNLKIRVIPEIGKSATATLEVMKNGYGYVLANSSFGWWAAFLSHSQGPVIVPDPWFKGIKEPCDLIPPHWIRQPAQFEEF
jgi:glycosyltransferase involved in cell wall biosynthesis